MGNYSRNTFDQNKNYVAVRMQQGVPLVDADWNELNDIMQNELYDAMKTAFPDGVPLGSDLSILLSLVGNDLFFLPGSVLIKGRPLSIRNRVQYTTQPWTNPAQANQDGVAVIPPLTTPAADRNDIVYLDVWEHEVNSIKDTNLVNSAIGIETCVRLKREAAFRVAEGSTTLPAPPPGHFFMPLAMLNRKAGMVLITYDQIVDIRPFLHSTQGIREVSFFPGFLPVDGQYPWKISTSNAFKLSSPEFAYGILPLVLPEGAHMTNLKIRGITYQANVEFWLKRYQNYSPSLWETLVHVGGIGNEGQFTNINLSIPILSTDRQNIVDNRRFYYVFIAIAGGGHQPSSIYGISIEYYY